MSLSKLVLPAFLVTALLVSGEAFAQTKSNTSTAKKVKKAKKPKTIARFGLGFGYMIWTESLKASDGGQSAKGYANYAGLLMYGDQTWTRNRLVYGASFGLGSGKATAEGFSPAVNYPDAGQRPWTMFYADIFSYYRIRANVMVGAGAFAIYRSADWQSSVNPTVTVEDRSKLAYSPEVLLRWTMTRHLTLVQSIAPLNFVGSTLWRWSAHYSF